MQIIFEKIYDEDSHFFRNFESRYLSDFPKVERREVKELIKILNNPNRPITLEAIIHEGDFAGFISYWRLPSYIYLEHFAIEPNKRSNGLGRQALLLFQKRFHQDKLLLEVEPPVDDITTRRINFYRRLGFTLSDLPYLQPAYRADDEAFPLKLMTMRFDTPIGEAEVNELKELVYDLKL